MRRYLPFANMTRGYTPTAQSTEAGLLAAEGLRARRVSFAKRPGTVAFGGGQPLTSPNALRPRAIAAPFFGGADLYVTYPDSVYRYNGGGDTWTDLTGSGVLATITLPTTSEFAWSGCMLFDDLFLTQGKRFDVGGLTNDGLLRVTDAGGSLARVTDSPGGRDIFAYAGRLFMLYVHDADGGFYGYRTRWCGPGDPTDWYVLGGYADLADDGYPLRRGLVMGGRAFMFKGNANGGSVVTCTATSSSAFPFVFEPAYGVGLLAPQTLVRVGRDLAVFLGHDNFYAMTVGDLQPLAPDVLAQQIFDELDVTRIDEAFTIYDSARGDLTLIVPAINGATYGYTYNLRAKTWTGPDGLSTWTSSMFGQRTVVESWDSTSALDTWDGGDETAWDYDTPNSSVPAVLITTTAGDVVALSDSATDDNGTPISTTLTTGDVDFDQVPFVVTSGRSRAVRYAGGSDQKSVDELHIRYRDYGVWTANIAISTDGGASWRSVYNSTLPGSGTEDVREKRITFLQIVGQRFRVRITNDSPTDRFAIVSIALGAHHVGPSVA